ncbi:hypothetical protein [Bartonella sp. CL434QHHD]|uniref:hypothetical protein n=1 Tax=Bartonella sp. CL434QHHD TaxID=3243529 RepID=UPI0035D0E563
MHHTLTGIRPALLASFLLSPPSSFPPSSFTQGTTSHALSKQTPTQPFQKGLSESQALWQAKRFRDYWQEKSGKEALKVNWQAP